MPLMPGNRAPDFSLPDTEGELRHLGLIFAPYTLLHFYTTEDKIFQRIQEARSTLHGTGVHILGITSKETKKNKSEVAILLDADTLVGKKYKIQPSIPTTVLLNSQKEIIKVVEHTSDNDLQLLFNYIDVLE